MRRTVVLSCLLLTGCVRQDTEILSRVGRKLADRVQTASSGIQDRLPFKISSGEPTMQACRSSDVLPYTFLPPRVSMTSPGA